MQLDNVGRLQEGFKDGRRTLDGVGSQLDCGLTCKCSMIDCQLGFSSFLLHVPLELSNWRSNCRNNVYGRHWRGRHSLCMLSNLA